MQVLHGQSTGHRRVYRQPETAVPLLNWIIKMSTIKVLLIRLPVQQQIMAYTVEASSVMQLFI